MDDLYPKAVDATRASGDASTRFLQQHFRIGFNRAARMTERMEEAGIISRVDENGKRHVLPVA